MAMLVVLASLTLLLWWVLTLDWALGVRRMADLADSPEGDVGGAADAPRLSVVIAARDEAATLGPTLAMLGSQQLPGLEVVVVDDRSHDGTAAVAAAAAARDARVRLVRVTELPPGWLGKTHALQVGADAAAGSWLLFTDADVRFTPGALARALAYARRRGLDHLVALPRLQARTPLLRSFVAAFALLFAVHTRPWRAPEATSRAAIGIGAFGLVRRGAYEAVGGHRAIRLRPDDDLSLGRRLKWLGFAQEAVFGGDLVAVEWYPDVRAAVKGLEKNAFAGMDYSVWRTAAVVTLLLLTNVMPFVAAVVVGGPARWLYLLTVATVAFVYAYDAPRSRQAPWLFVLHPLGTALLALALARSTAAALISGEVEWRGTRYSLEELRGGRGRSG